jgi:hypothetical protein
VAKTIYDHGTTNLHMGTGLVAEMSLFQLLGSTQMDSWAGVGDLPMGSIQTPRDTAVDVEKV